jgi:hypothetical protein
MEILKVAVAAMRRVSGPLCNIAAGSVTERGALGGKGGLSPGGPGCRLKMAVGLATSLTLLVELENSIIK